uniref:Uncharacterized protein n=1 Tax=Megaselia scalaris TaxID=36166 RepID=T1GC93_MEGSC
MMEFLQSTPEKNQILFDSLGCKEFSRIESTEMNLAPQLWSPTTHKSRNVLFAFLLLAFLLPVISQVDSNMSLEKQMANFYGWITEEEQISIIKPVICGLLFSMFSCCMIILMEMCLELNLRHLSRHHHRRLPIGT